MRALLLPLAALLAACTTPPSASQSLPSGKGSPSVAATPRLDAQRIVEAIHVRTNAERQRHGLPVLAWRDDLAALAAVHSRDMAAHGFFDHTAPDGSDVNARGARLQMTCRYEVGDAVYTGFSENLFSLFPYRGWREITDERGTRREYDYRAEAEIAPEVVTGWMNSPGHRANLLGATSRAEGIAVATAGDGKLYITQVFC